MFLLKKKYFDTYINIKLMANSTLDSDIFQIQLIFSPNSMHFYFLFVSLGTFQHYV